MTAQDRPPYHASPDQLTARVFRALYRDYDLVIKDALYWQRRHGQL